ncbi:alpha/beta hydrolase [Nonomuraea sp. 3-1Str]|nr:alpha/beta fold hydrolase [Nonomuraea sp. 3-1Str]MDR8413380.1 alpha/beta hydrolase [Nonomuraea sp. 3-1Str]
MPAFTAYDGTPLAYHALGEGDPLVCLPGGPMQDSAYLGDLGGLTAHRRLIMVDPRGTGRSAIPEDAASYRCDRLVDDVEALREHLGLDRIDLLAHCAGANLATLYAARHPERVGRLALITPSTRAVGLDATGEARMATARLRKDEPWFGPAFAALEAIVAGRMSDDNWKAIDPFYYGRWDAAAQAHNAAQDGRRNDEAAAAFGAEGVFDPDATRAALAAFGAGAGPRRRGGPELDPGRRGRVRRALAEGRVHRPAGGGPLPVARRPRPLRDDDRGLPGLTAPFLRRFRGDAAEPRPSALMVAFVVVAAFVVRVRGRDVATLRRDGRRGAVRSGRPPHPGRGTPPV